MSLKSKVHKLLRWSEHYTNTDMVYFARGGFYLSIAKALNIVIGLGLVVAFANLLEPEKYGNYKYIITLVSIAGVFTLTGINSAVSRSVAKGFDGILRDGVYTAMQWSIGATIILLCASTYYFFNDNVGLSAGLLIGALTAPLIAGWSLYNNFLAGAQQYIYQGGFSVIRNLSLALLLFVVLFFSHEPAILAIFYFLGTALILWLLYSLTLKIFRPSRRTDPDVLSHAKHLSLIVVLSTLAAQLDKVLVFSQIGATALAIYSFALIGPQQFRDMNSIVASVAFPKMSRRTFKELQHVIPSKSFPLFIVAIVVCAIYILFIPLLFKLFFPLYIDAVPYSQVLILSILFVFPATLYNQAFITHKKNKELYILNTVVPLLRLGLMVGLMPFYGIWGLVGATVFSYAVGFLLLLYLFFKADETTDVQKVGDNGNLDLPEKELAP